MSLGDTFLPCADLFSGAGHVGQRLFAGAAGGNFCELEAGSTAEPALERSMTAISLRAQKPDILWLLLIPGHFEALQPI